MEGKDKWPASVPPLQRERLQCRIRDIWLAGRIQCLEGRLTPDGLEKLRSLVRDTAEQTEQIDAAGFLSGAQLAWLEELKERSYTILDVFDALVADDRPYYRSGSHQQAKSPIFRILYTDAQPVCKQSSKKGQISPQSIPSLGRVCFR